MNAEISEGTRLGIMLIALAAVIGIGFVVFGIGKSKANEGTVAVQDNISAVSESTYEDYNDKIVTGTMVKAAVNNFAGKSIAILINTAGMDNEVKPYASHETLHVSTFSSDGKCTGYAEKTGDEENIGTKPSDGHYYVNYNALLDMTDADEDTLYLKDGVYVADGIPFAINSLSGKVEFDNSIGGFARSGNCEYLNPTAKFEANLIKDTTGTIIGILFTQMVS